MLSKLCVLSALAMASARTTWKDLDKYDFEQFMAEFHLKYTSSELESRRSLFRDELARVRAHNAKNLSWKVNLNVYIHIFPFLNVSNRLFLNVCIRNMCRKE